MKESYGEVRWTPAKAQNVSLWSAAMDALERKAIFLDAFQTEPVPSAPFTGESGSEIRGGFAPYSGSSDIYALYCRKFAPMLTLPVRIICIRQEDGFQVGGMSTSDFISVYGLNAYIQLLLSAVRRK
jgi:hypothetical protein